jgi:hypothetical protein
VGAEEAAAEAGHPGVSCAQGAQRQLCHVQLGGPREEGLPPPRVRVLSQKPAQEEVEVVCVGDMYGTIPHEPSLVNRLPLAQSILIVLVLVELWWA